jgi:hypothetical protein
MNDNLESIDKSDKKKGTGQRNETGSEDPSAISLEEAKEKTDYYEEGDGGATD